MPRPNACWTFAAVPVLALLSSTAQAQSQAGFPPVQGPSAVAPPQGQPYSAQPRDPQVYPQGYVPAQPYSQELGPFQRRPMVDEAPLDRPGYVRHSRKAGRHLHDGFYLRLSGGVGFGGFSASTEPFQFYVEGQGGDQVDDFDGSGGGFAYGTQIAVGGALRPGAVLALAFNTLTVPQLTLTHPAREFGNYEYRISQVAGVGPLFDFFPDPSAGLHVSGGLSVVGLVIGQADTDDGARARGHTALGWGFNLGIAYEWWVGEEWSLGLQARLDYTHGSGSDARDNDWSHSLWAPTVGLGLTYN
ncbi:MAG: hypothetical protein R3B89_30105 [Polyangiaceae bacterium]